MRTLQEAFQFLLQESQYKYLGQCDKLRRNCAEREGYWQEMMAQKKPIPFKTLIQSVDMSPVLDEEETPEEFIRNAKSSDPETQSYQSVWGGKPCMFLQTAGFEFIFVQQ